jgi:hypothetical protein
MPPNYKYTFISLGSKKALEMAASRAFDLHSELAKSRVIDPSVVERARVLRILIGRAASNPMESADVKLLDELLGANTGDVK